MNNLKTLSASLVIVGKSLLLTSLLLCLCPHVAAATGDTERDRLKESGQVMKEILGTPEDLPQDLLNKAECVIVLPSVKKVAVGIGASYGRGVMLCPCRDSRGSQNPASNCGDREPSREVLLPSL